MPQLDWLPGEFKISSTPKACAGDSNLLKPVFRNVLLINRRAAVAAHSPLREPPVGINVAELNHYRLRPCPLERRAILTARAQFPAL
jgi:hypothetical protein